MAKPAKTRMCLMCRENFEKTELLRFVLDPANNLFLDIYGKAPARGNYVYPSAKCLDKAINKQVLIKMLKANKNDNFKQDVTSALLVKVKGNLAMLKKAQLFAPGAEQTIELLKKNKAEFVLFASDISENSESKVKSVLDESKSESLKLLKKEQLSDFVGIPNCSVLAFKRSKLTTSLQKTLKVLEILG